MFRQKIFMGCVMLILALPVQAAVEDPTRPPGMSEAPSIRSSESAQVSPRWVLTSTLVSPDRRSAVINDRVVSLGDRVNGATVVEINPSEVRLRASGHELTLVMLKNNIKSVSTQPNRQ